MNIASIKNYAKNVMPSQVYDNIVRIKGFFTPKIPDFQAYVGCVKGKGGIEIGGPSPLFKAALPLYQNVASLDGVNFSNSTVWEGEIEAGMSFRFFEDKVGRQYISDGTSLSELEDGKYEFVLSSNCLEHIANPLKALSEWRRILRNDGFLILILPNNMSNFDHKRPVTKFSHLLDDYQNEMSEHDLTHLDEILSLHDLSLDPPAGDLENFRARSLNNFNNRTLHHHVFDASLMREMMKFLKMEIVQENETKTDHLLIAINNGNG
jgi:SAM-dependent methyltransferase